jgi:NADH-quinone oxidoreductase subunit K
MVDYVGFLLTGAVLFVLGLIGFVVRRNLVVMFLCTELMLQGILLTLVAFNRHWLEQWGPGAGLDGQVFTLLLLAMAAAEAALALIFAVALQRRRGTLDASAFAELKG